MSINTRDSAACVRSQRHRSCYSKHRTYTGTPNTHPDTYGLPQLLLLTRTMRACTVSDYVYIYMYTRDAI